MPSVAAIVVSLPERHRLLVEALDSVHSQTRPPDDLVLGIDPRRLGEAGNMNRLIQATDTEWLAFLHDDDLWHPDHLAVCLEHTDADVILSRFALDGRPADTIEPWHTDVEDFRFTNWVCSPSCVLARRDTFGAWCDPYGPYRWVDWANWNRLLDRGAIFADTRTVTVTCRFGDWGNGSWRAQCR